jgi:hypothetical protein
MRKGHKGEPDLSVRPRAKSSLITGALGEPLPERGRVEDRDASNLMEAQEVRSVTEPLVVELEGRDTLEEALVLGDEVLIGETVLEKLDLFVDCQGRRLVPNPPHPDQLVTKVK